VADARSMDPGVDSPRGVSRWLTGLLVLGLVSAWLVLYAVSILGSIWRFREPGAPPPVLTTHDQVIDLVVLAVQLVVGAAALWVVIAVRRRFLTAALPERSGSAMDAAVAWCAAIAVASAVVLVLDRTGVMRFEFSTPATVESPWLAVLAALSAGLREEPLLAALPLVLLVGRIPIGWIMVLAGAMRGLIYLYFGMGGFIWAFVWGAAAVWVYYRFRRLWVLILVHGMVMNIQALDRVLVHDSMATLLQWVNILVLFGALMWWLVPRALDSMIPGASRSGTAIPVLETDVSRLTPVDNDRY
jgi:hypothetical protein